MDIVLLFVGFVFAALGAGLLRSARSDAESSQRFEGTVAGYALDRDRRGTRTFAPVVRVQHPELGDALFRNPLASGSLSYALGQRVAVLVRRDETLRARIDTPGMTWFAAAFLAAGIGAIVAFFATFRPNAFSIVIAAAIAVSIAFQLRRFRKRLPAARTLARSFRQATTAELCSEAAFDRSVLLPRPELETLLRRRPRQSLVAALILLSLGGGGIAGSWFWTKSRAAFLDHALRASGSVVAMESSRGSRSQTWAPVVEFTPAGAWEPVRFKHRVSSSHPSWRVGDRVAVLYDPQHPADAMIDAGFWNTAVPWIPGTVGALFLLLAVFSLRDAMRSRETMPLAPI